MIRVEGFGQWLLFTLALVYVWYAGSHLRAGVYHYFWLDVFVACFQLFCLGILKYQQRKHKQRMAELDQNFSELVSRLRARASGSRNKVNWKKEGF